MLSRHQGRRLAVQAMYNWDIAQVSQDEVLKFDWYEGDEPLDFSRLLVAGTITELERIDNEISARLEHWDLARVTRVDLAILRISVYSLLFQADIPAQVTIDEAIELAREFSTTDSYRFVNGILDTVRKENERPIA